MTTGTPVRTFGLMRTERGHQVSQPEQKNKAVVLSVGRRVVLFFFGRPHQFADRSLPKSKVGAGSCVGAK